MIDVSPPQWFRRLFRGSAAAVVLSVVFPIGAHSQSFQGLGFLPGYDVSYAYSLSADGSVVSGWSYNGNYQAYRWTAATGMLDLGSFPAGWFGPAATGISADGSIVVGSATNSNNLYKPESFFWTAQTGVVSLGLPASSATAISGNGSVIVGEFFQSNQHQQEAFRWNAMTGAVGLGFLPGDFESQALGVNADGTVVVGISANGDNPNLTRITAFRWTQPTGMVSLGVLSGADTYTAANAVSGDGAVVVGASAGVKSQAFRWTQATGMVGLGSLYAGGNSQAYGISADGSVIVGYSSDVNNSNGIATRWTAATGIQSIPAMLTAVGVNLGGWELTTAYAASANGTVVAGVGFNPAGQDEAWIAQIPINAFALLDLHGSDHSLGSLVWGGTVTNNGPGPATLTAGGDNTDSTFIGTIQDGTGTTAFTKIGTGTLTLTGISTYTGATTLDAGTLSVSGSIAASSLITVNTGAVLTGSGTVGNTAIASGGIFAPGSGTPGTSTTVAGNLAFASGAVYLAQINPSTASFAGVTGAASLSGAIVDAIYANGSYVSKQYTILTAAGGVGGAFNELVNTNLPSGFTAGLSYDANDVYLDLQLFGAPQTGPSTNQKAVAGALSNSFNTSGGIPLVFGKLTPMGLTQASGELATGTQQATFDAMGLFMGLLTDPFVTGRGNPVAPAGSTSSFANDDDHTSAYAGHDKTRSKDERNAYSMIAKALPQSNPYDPHWSVWTAGFGGSETTSGNAVVGSNTATSSVYGTTVGADYLFSRMVSVSATPTCSRPARSRVKPSARPISPVRWPMVGRMSRPTAL
jgi:autotransporter-associated beta strand protein/probable HAF family extracellular repeat protein